MNNHRFFSDFRRGLRKDHSLLRPDEWPYFISWPLVYLLRRSRVTPNHLGFASLLVGLAFIAGLLLNFHDRYPLLMAVLIFIRIVLDCADGQLARYTGQLSNLGALYDLAGDFLFGVLLFPAIFISLSAYGMTSLQYLAAFLLLAAFSFMSTSTLSSFFSRLEDSGESSQEKVRKAFLQGLENDRPGDPVYSRKIALFNSIFLLTWHWVSRPVFLLFVKNIPIHLRHRLALLLSFFEYGVHLIVLFIIISLNVDLMAFLIFEVLGFIITLLILIAHYALYPSNRS